MTRQAGYARKAEGIRLLVVDDEPADVAVLRWALESVGPAEIVHMADGEQARQVIATLEPHSFDGILVDWNLPGSSGEELAETYLSRNAPERRAPLVLMSGLMPESAMEGLRGKGAVILEKPIDLDAYRRTAERVFHLCRPLSEAL